MSEFERVALTIAGSDSGGGAGIQADLRTFSFHCVHGTSAITCVTAQNTLEVKKVEALAPEMVVAQIEAVISDIGALAVKTGMLLNREIIEAVARQVEKWRWQNLVVDPVMVSRTGARLIDDRSIAGLREMLLPRALIVTPNRYEAQILSGRAIDTLDDMKAAAVAIHDFGAANVLIKGGGMKGALQGVDVWFDGRDWEILKTTAIKTPNTHGTGCTLSAAIAANLALGKNLHSAINRAKAYVSQALQHSLSIGKGTGTLGHFFPLQLERFDNPD